MCINGPGGHTGADKEAVEAGHGQFGSGVNWGREQEGGGLFLRWRQCTLCSYPIFLAPLVEVRGDILVTKWPAGRNVRHILNFLPQAIWSHTQQSSFIA